MVTPPDARRILIVRPSALGDVLRSVPVLASLRRAYPDATIDWVVQDTFSDAVAAHPALDEIVPFPRQRFAAWARSLRVAGELRRWLADLRRRAYDLVLDCQGLGRSGLITWATRAPCRVGERDAREGGWLGYTLRPAARRGAHAVDRMLALVAALGIDPIDDMRLHVAPADRDWWAEARRASGVGRYVLLAPTTRWASKRWPVDRWAGLLEPLRERGHTAAVVIGAPGEREQVGPLVAGRGPGPVPVIDLVGATTIGRTLAVVAEADLVLACDSAPLHAAVGFDRPCVGLFGPTDPSLVGPYRRPEAIVQAVTPGAARAAVNYRRADDALMRAISPAMVLGAIDRVTTGATTPLEGGAPP